ncbi:ABC-2 type transport system ATP-binding protein [Natranaerovirga hydrolytica]|uniref:ABC-2 type transport system ATP-binding protein n=1 Tax=Natranaerovirga hydrolytica TaxID=680378 RepID=A0A4V2Q0C0_9FIRM|nr:ABC transporter ATP-binding protein [Natranaerovirga hydrolytica]TCK93211.1 ABC-2 type transport system ATP-binding protein [Natranaerovirga hydrolytica]
MVIDIQNLSKIYTRKKKPPVVANDNLSLALEEGEILGLLGHNGAGKTTLVNQILGLTKPTNGDIMVMGESVMSDPKRARQLCSVQPQSQVPLSFLTPEQAVLTMGKMRGGKEKDIKNRMKNLFQSLDIEEWAKTEGEKLSGGIQRLTAFCMAIVNPGKIVILDEPTNDIDAVRRRYLWEEIRQLTQKGSSVILVTHNVLEAEKAVDRVAILHQGKLLAKGKPSEIKQTVNRQLRMEINLAMEPENINLPSWILSHHMDKERLTLSLEQSSVPIAIEWAQSNIVEGKINDYSLSPSSLEDVYVKLTGGRSIEEPNKLVSGGLSL